MKIHQIFTISIISFVLLFFISIHFKIEPRSQIILDIPSGSSATTISTYLDENKIILSPMLFKIYAKLSFADKKFKAGEYKIETPHSIYDLSKKITSGDFYYRKLTLLPGLKVSDILKLGDSKYLINDLKKNPYEVMKSYGIEMQEGIFFADTYYYLKGESFSSVLIKSNKKWIKFSQEIWKKRTAETRMVRKYRIISINHGFQFIYLFMFLYLSIYIYIYISIYFYIVLCIYIIIYIVY